jgi:anthranilate synthase component 2
MLLLIDNYDSFVYNVFHWIDVAENEILVRRNDAVTVDSILADNSTRGIIISPGPMGPPEAGISNELISRAGRRGIPVLGICLGHQCIGHVFGCTITRHPAPVHGKAGRIELASSPLFDGLPSAIEAARYHSLHISPVGFNDNELQITARLSDGTIMGIQHRRHPIYGVQFHPESVLSGDHGKRILNNFARLVCHLEPAEHSAEPR